MVSLPEFKFKNQEYYIIQVTFYPNAYDLRGECEHENIICRPTFDSKLSPAELRVLRYWVQGLTKEEVAQELYLSPHTVHSPP